MAQIEVRFFGRLADRFGRSLMLDCGDDGLTVAAIRRQLGGELGDPARARPVVADCLVGEEERIAAGAAVEFLPPLSGG